MRWRGLRKRLLDRIADDIRPRIDMQASSCRCPSCKGQGIGSLIWKVDGEVVANFCDLAWENAQGYGSKSASANRLYETAALGYGEVPRSNAFDDCWRFLHDLSVSDALRSDSPVIRSLAVMDKRTGRRRIEQMDRTTLHPLVRRFADLRLDRSHASHS